MILLIVGDDTNANEVRAKFGDRHQYLHAINHPKATGLLNTCDVVFDFAITQDPSQMSIYNNSAPQVIFLNSVKASLKKLCCNTDHTTRSFFGFNGMPTFFNREMLEVSLLHEDQLAKLQDECSKLNSLFERVKDTVGMVTARVICMIINEAYYTLEEGTASREDIDLAMKLGTNYPYGPFEWCLRIGAKEVCDLLNAVYHDTQDDRYQICQLLLKESQAL